MIILYKFKKKHFNVSIKQINEPDTFYSLHEIKC